MFSTRAISITFSSLMVRMYAGMALSPASCEARHLRSPAMIWNRLSSTCLRVMGCMMPSSRMLLASSCRASGSNSLRGWLGLASIMSMEISLMVELPCGLTASVEMSASSPRPRGLLYLFLIAIVVVCYSFLLMISLASAKWFLLPMASAS